MTKDQVTSLIERLAEKQYHPGDHLKTQPQIMPILLGDVLERMLEIKKGDPRGMRILLTGMWGECGFKKSLQQIISESGWELDCKYWPCDPLCKGEERLKDENARALFDFLLNLFPNE